MNIQRAFLIIVVLVGVVFLSGCISSTSEIVQGDLIYSGEWKVAADHFLVKKNFNDTFVGKYDAYKNEGTITLIGSGEQTNPDNDGYHDIKIIFQQNGSNVKVSYYLDKKLRSYDVIKNITVDKAFDLTIKTWEIRLSTAEEKELKTMDKNTEQFKI